MKTNTRRLSQSGAFARPSIGIRTTRITSWFSRLFRAGSTLVCLGLIGTGLVGMGLVGKEPAAAAGTELSAAETEVTRLIAQLGSDQFLLRERAQEELRGLGLSAFDALLHASQDDDVEISLRARYLVRSMPVRWSTDNDSPEVRALLRDYGTSGRTERRNRMQQLTALPDSAGVLPLCRLARFEVDSALSKEAALFVINLFASGEAKKNDGLAKQIAAAVGKSQRTASLWLKAYSRTLTEPSSTLDDWHRMTVEEQQTFANFPDRTDRYIVRDLFRWYADLLRSLQRQEEFLVAVRDSLELVEGRLPELYDAVDWAADREAWTAVDEVARRFASEFNRHAILVYRQAESQLRRGDDDLADETAARALKIDPKSLDDHVILADRLHSRLLYDWAEREYRFVIASSRPAKNDGLHMEARFYLADMLVDLEKELSAAKVLEEALELIKADKTVLAPSQRSPEKVEASMHYYFALDFRRKGDLEKQIEHLEAAYLLDPENPDILIAMYRVPVIDVVWQETARKRIETLKQRMHDRIKAAEQLVENPRSERARLDAMQLLAQALNELAWLTSNTTGDFSAAVRFSQRSLELRPGSPAYLDTLGRCFFAAGDVENAVKHQAKAVERAPRYQQIRRQLKTFQDSLAQARGEPN